MKKLACTLTVALAVFLALSAGAKDLFAQPIRIAVLGPMAFVQGEGHWNGAVLAAEAINAKGGIMVGKMRRPIELIRVDTNEFLSLPDATSAAERAIHFHRADFLVGGFRTEAVLAMQDIAMDEKKIFLGVGAAHPELNTRVLKNFDRYKYWFRVSPLNSIHMVRINFIILEMVARRIAAELKIPKLSVAIVAEKAVWADPMIKIAQETLPKMGMEIVGIWRPSPVATDVMAELTAIARSGAHIIFTVIAHPVGIPFARQWGELKIPAAMVGINMEAQRDGFWAATGGRGNYSVTLNTYARVRITEYTIPFVDAYRKRFGETPTYTAGTYEAINILAAAITRAGAIDSDRVVAELQKTDIRGPAGRLVFDKSHDVTFGPGFVTAIATQWVDGVMHAVWPFDWQGITYEGTVPYRIPPWMIEHFRKK